MPQGRLVGLRAIAFALRRKTISNQIKSDTSEWRNVPRTLGVVPSDQFRSPRAFRSTSQVFPTLRCGLNPGLTNISYFVYPYLHHILLCHQLLYLSLYSKSSPRCRSPARSMDRDQFKTAAHSAIDDSMR
jgi:hypothetical protein